MYCVVEGVVCLSISVMEDLIRNLNEGHTPLLQQELSFTHTLTDTQTCTYRRMSGKKSKCSYFLTAVRANSFQLLPGWENCYGNTPSTKTNVGLISKWTQKWYKPKQDDKAGCPGRNWHCAHVSRNHISSQRITTTVCEFWACVLTLK